MIRQESNAMEWEDYKAYWMRNLNPRFGDQVSVFDVHNWANEDSEVSNRINKLAQLSKASKVICSDLIDRMFIQLNGEVALCCGDEMGVHDLGNVLQDDPVDIYNRGVFSYYREMMQDGRLAEINYCKNCQIILSRMQKEYLDA